MRSDFKSGTGKSVSYVHTVSDTASGRIESYAVELPRNSTVEPILLQSSGTIYGGAAYRRQAGNFTGFEMRSNPCMNLCLCYLCQMICCGRPFFFCC